MSLEQALVDNTAAITKLTAALTAAGAQTGNAQAEPKKAAKPKADKPVDATTPVKSEPAPTTQAAATGGAVPALKTVTDSVLDFAAENTAEAKAILRTFGATRCSELKPDSYQKVLDAVTAAKAKIAADLLAGNDDSDSLV